MENEKRFQMEITYKNKKLKMLCESEKDLKKSHGKQNAKYIQVGLALLDSAPNLSKVYGVRRFGLHQLKGGRKGQFALKLHDGKRLVFKPKSDPVLQKSDGGIDEEKITEVTILEIVNYHRK